MSNPVPGFSPNPEPYPRQPPPAPPKKSKTWIVVLIIVAVVIIGFVGACGAIMSSVSNSVNTALSDPEVTASAPAPKGSSKAPAEKPAEEAKPYTIKATACKRGSYGQVEISVKVENHTDKKRTYLFDIAVEDTDGNTVGSGFGSIGNVRPGKTGTANTFASMSDDEYDGKIKCVVEVTDF